MEQNWDINTIIGRLHSKLIQEKIKFEALSKILISKGILTEKELDELFWELYEDKSLKYSAESLNLSVEEFQELIKEK